MSACQRCGQPTRIMGQATISAPSELSYNFSKTNLRRKDVCLVGVNWETMDTICENPKCGKIVNAYGNYISRLEKENAQLRAQLGAHMTTTLPTLYKRNSNATAIQQWTISVDDATITTTYGQVGGAMQTTSDTIAQGKNLGKKNATMAPQQAVLEAEAQHEKKRKSGYIASLEQAQKGDLDEVIEGGIIPMLAKVYEDRADKVGFPVAVQPKLDGHRCVAVCEFEAWHDTDGSRHLSRLSVSLWTRTRKRIKSVPHIEQQLTESLESALTQGNIVFNEDTAKAISNMRHYCLVLDGECYADSHKDRFEELTSLLRHDHAVDGHDIVEYHVYDIVSPDNFLQRFAKLEHIFDATTHIKLVETHVAVDEAALLGHYDHFRRAGYEGAMCRTLGTPYEHKRSSSLLKMKDFVDAEARIVGVEEGRGRLQGHVGAFVCEMPDGKQFNCKLAGAIERLREAFENQAAWIGATLKYKYQGLTSDGKPRFPSGLCRVDEIAK